MKNTLLSILLFFFTCNIYGQIDIEGYLLDSTTSIILFNGIFFPTFTASYIYDSDDALKEINTNSNYKVYLEYEDNREIRTFVYKDIFGNDSVSIEKHTTDFNDAGNRILQKSYYFDYLSETFQLGIVDSILYNDQQLLTEKYFTYQGGSFFNRNYSKYSYNPLNQLQFVEEYHSSSNMIEYELRRRQDYYYVNGNLSLTIDTRYLDNLVLSDSTTYSYEVGKSIQENISYQNDFKTSVNRVEHYSDNNLKYRLEYSSELPFSDTIILYTTIEQSEYPFIPFNNTETFDITTGDTSKVSTESYNLSSLENENLRLIFRSQGIAINTTGTSLNVRIQDFRLKNNLDNENQDLNTINLFPNPVRNGGILFFKEAVGIGVNAQIYNSIGQLISIKPVINQKFINIENDIIPGTYYLVLEKEGKRLSQATPFIIVN